MIRQILLAGACVATLAACGKPADETKGAATPTEQAATPDANPAATVPTAADEAAAPDFVVKASASDMFEVETSKLAVERSKDPEVKKFARMMVNAHTASTAALKKAITASGKTLTIPEALPADLQDKLDDLKKADAKDFDKKYADLQKDQHQAALDLLQRYAQDGDDVSLRAFAAATAPVVQGHLNTAEGLKKGLN